MSYLNHRYGLGHIALIIGIASIPAAADAWRSEASIVSGDRNYFEKKIPDAEALPSTGSSSVTEKQLTTRVSRVGAERKSGRVQTDYYERRRRYWEKRLDTRLEEEDLENDDNADSNSDSDFDEPDADEDLYQRRRDYVRDRLDEDW